jgi:hypothetical protein
MHQCGSSTLAPLEFTWTNRGTRRRCLAMLLITTTHLAAAATAQKVWFGFLAACSVRCVPSTLKRCLQVRACVTLPRRAASRWWTAPFFLFGYCTLSARVLLYPILMAATARIVQGEVPPEELLSTIDLRLLHFNYWPGWVPLEQSIYSGCERATAPTVSTLVRLSLHHVCVRADWSATGRYDKLWTDDSAPWSRGGRCGSEDTRRQHVAQR